MFASVTYMCHCFLVQFLSVGLSRDHMFIVKTPYLGYARNVVNLFKGEHFPLMQASRDNTPGHHPFASGLLFLSFLY